MIKFKKNMFIKLINKDKVLNFKGFNKDKTIIYCEDYPTKYTLNVKDIDWDFTEKINDFVLKERMFLKIKKDHWFDEIAGKIFKVDKILNFKNYNVYLPFEKLSDGESIKIIEDDIDFIRTLEINIGDDENV